MPIDPSAYVDKSAVVSDSAVIAPRAYVGKGCIIHDNVTVGYNAIVECHTEIGEGTVLSPNAHVGGAPQDYTYKNEDTKLKIGKNCIIREFAPVHRATTKEDWITEIGDNCMIMTLSHVGHDCKFGSGITLVSSTMVAGHVKVGDFAVISGYCAIHQGIRIGTMAMTAGMSRIGADVPPYCMAAGSERSQIEGLNVVGLKRRGVTPEARIELKRAVNILLDKSLLFEEVKEKMKDLNQLPEIVNFREFLENSKRGVLRR